MNDFFSLIDPFMDYTVSQDVVDCNDCSSNEGQWCQCSLCCCCSVCADSCTCPCSIKDVNEQMMKILGFGDDMYR